MTCPQIRGLSLADTKKGLSAARILSNPRYRDRNQDT